MKKELELLLLKIGLLLLFLVILFAFFFGVTVPKDDSLTPSVKAGDIVLYYRLSKNCQTGDLAVLEEADGSQRIARVTAVVSSGLQVEKTADVDGGTDTDDAGGSAGTASGTTLQAPDAADEKVETVSKDTVKGTVITIVRRSRF